MTGSKPKRPAVDSQFFQFWGRCSGGPWDGQEKGSQSLTLVCVIVDDKTTAADKAERRMRVDLRGGFYFWEAGGWAWQRGAEP